tara:strand:+ start:4833 stop:5087 length:255 start_codon:yes stop_codon:yes gene_type:complete
MSSRRTAAAAADAQSAVTFEVFDQSGKVFGAAIRQDNATFLFVTPTPLRGTVVRKPFYVSAHPDSTSSRMAAHANALSFALLTR